MLRLNTLCLMLLLGLSMALSACGSSSGGGDDGGPGGGDPGTNPDPTGVLPAYTGLLNPEAVIPPQCYTRTDSQHNPCFTCHQTYLGLDPDRANQMNDGDLQGEYQFSDLGVTNHWTNLFKDRSAQVAAITDDEIQAYVAQDNFSELAGRLQAAGWEGYLPVLADYAGAAAAFDEQGFARDGSGWVAFNYKPLPSTFWPTNGSTDDVLIRLPEEFRRAGGLASRDIYLLNLSIVEMAIKELDEISIPVMDERTLGVDLNGDTVLTSGVTLLRRPQFYLGDAAASEVIPQMYPVGVEFLHSVRYVGVTPEGDIHVPPRMKELRYMRKNRAFNLAQLSSMYGNEHQEKLEGQLPSYNDHGARGMYNGFGWHILGFIEDAGGRLRKQTYEETLFCMGCHTTIGTTIDQTFAFPRKVTGARGWGYIDLRGMEDAPARGAAEGEILHYLSTVGGGDEFRQNEEMRERWFTSTGEVDVQKVQAADVYELITPSRRRALDLNKAYLTIVREQSFIHGRDATITSAVNVYEEVDPDAVTPLPPEAHLHGWDIRLDWGHW